MVEKIRNRIKNNHQSQNSPNKQPNNIEGQNKNIQNGQQRSQIDEDISQRSHSTKKNGQLQKDKN